MSALKLYVNCPENEKAQAADQRQLSQSNMQEELKEVIRVLQLVSSDWPDLIKSDWTVVEIMFRFIMMFMAGNQSACRN